MRAKGRFALYGIIFLLGFGKFIPIYYAPEFLRAIFSSVLINYLHVPILILIVYLLFKAFRSKNNRKEVSAVAVVYLLLLVSSPIIREGCNKITMRVNNDRNVPDFINPILGMTMEKKLDINMVYYKFNKGFLIYDALVYKENHQMSMDIPEIRWEASIKKIYNKDWYWYLHFD